MHIYCRMNTYDKVLTTPTRVQHLAAAAELAAEAKARLVKNCFN